MQPSHVGRRGGRGWGRGSYNYNSKNSFNRSFEPGPYFPPQYQPQLGVYGGSCENNFNHSLGPMNYTPYNNHDYSFPAATPQQTVEAQSTLVTPHSSLTFTGYPHPQQPIPNCDWYANQILPPAYNYISPHVNPYWKPRIAEEEDKTRLTERRKRSYSRSRSSTCSRTVCPSRSRSRSRSYNTGSNSSSYGSAESMERMETRSRPRKRSYSSSSRSNNSNASKYQSRSFKYIQEKSSSSSKLMMESASSGAIKVQDDKLDLSTVVEPLSSFVNDRKQLLREAVNSLGSKDFCAIIPDALKNMNLDDLEDKCLELLDTLKSEHLINIMSGEKLEESESIQLSSDPEEEETDDDDTKIKKKLKKRKKHKSKKNHKHQSNKKSKHDKNTKKHHDIEKKVSDANSTEESEKKFKSSSKGEKRLQNSLMELLEMEYKTKALKSLLLTQGFDASKMNQDLKIQPENEMQKVITLEPVESESSAVCNQEEVPSTEINNTVVVESDDVSSIYDTSTKSLCDKDGREEDFSAQHNQNFKEIKNQSLMSFRQKFDSESEQSGNDSVMYFQTKFQPIANGSRSRLYRNNLSKIPTNINSNDDQEEDILELHADHSDLKLLEMDLANEEELSISVNEQQHGFSRAKSLSDSDDETTTMRRNWKTEKRISLNEEIDGIQGVFDDEASNEAHINTCDGRESPREYISCYMTNSPEKVTVADQPKVSGCSERDEGTDFIKTTENDSKDEPNSILEEEASADVMEGSNIYSNETESAPITWFERWFNGQQNQKIIKSNKLQIKVRRKLVLENEKQKKSIIIEPSSPSKFEPIIGTIDEYQRLFKKEVPANHSSLLSKDDGVIAEKKNPNSQCSEEDLAVEEEDDGLWGDIIGSNSD